ncbi:hypothetical protein [Nonomuraea angiospora]|uniref:hypothetical protein n=1 Tax=Nonomuraea angiospora TaxID=46172 RepID=UPI0029A41CF3|nr:hypothetical protein [Nonomuraea angiospora]MDX3106904.1 hypothetical protein [Nonomuraea angiospora]
MSTDLREMPFRDRSPLELVEHVFQFVASAHGGLALEGTELSHELPRRQIPLTELRDLLASPMLCNVTRDVVWRELVIRARRDGPEWLTGAVGTAMPALRRICGRLCLYPIAGDPAKINTEVLAAFVAAVEDIDLDQPNILPRMCAAAQRTGERARRNAETEAAQHISEHAPKRPAAPWQHPDLVLADAVGRRMVRELDAELIGLTAEAVEKRRQWCEQVLADAVLAGNLERAPSLSITPAAPSGAEDTPKTSARSRITSDPESITNEQKGGRGSLIGSARNPFSTRQRRRRRRLIQSVLVVAVIAIVLAAAASVALADSSIARRAAAVPQDLNTVFDNLRNWLIGLLAALATLMLTIGGLRYLVAGGDPGEVQKAKAALKAAAFGYGLAVLAPLFVSVLKRIVGGG